MNNYLVLLRGKVFAPRDGVDKIWGGDGVIYSQQLSSERAKSRLADESHSIKSNIFI